LTDVLVLGAGLAGLSCARDLARAGTDVVVLEARDRVGGRVEQVHGNDGRPVQLGGEVVGEFHAAYLRLVEELGLTLQPSYTATAGQTTFDLLEGVSRGDSWPFPTEADRADFERVEALFGRLAATVDPDDPWSHADSSRLDTASLAGWLRSVDARPAVVRRLEVAALYLADGSSERTSLLAALRKSAAARDTGFYSEAIWESLQVSEGSAEVARRMAVDLGERIRLAAVVRSVSISRSGCRVGLAGGEELTAEAVVCALPVGVLGGIEIDGVAEERLASLRAQRMALAAKVVAVYPRAIWEDVGANGLAAGEHVLGSTWPQHDGVLSALVPPDRVAYLVATPEADRRRLVHDELARMYGAAARTTTSVHVRIWASDPFARGYITQWWPGDVMRVGPLHGTHDPPFYVCGSDQWVAGYMEGAVRTGRGAATAALAGASLASR
jgi:monoamine oxidase